MRYQLFHRIRDTTALFAITASDNQIFKDAIQKYFAGELDQLAKMSKRIQSRKEWAEKAGLGFALSKLCTQCTKKGVIPIKENAA